MGDVIGVLMGSMRQDQLDAAEGLLELLDCRELHLLEGNPIHAAVPVVRHEFLARMRARRANKVPAAPWNAPTNAPQADVLQFLVVTHPSALEAYLGIIRKCNVLIGTPAGVEAARAYKPLATYWTVPK
jgi:hypothetical protein